MTSNPLRQLKDERGYGLVELMITLIVMGAVLIGVFATFFRSTNATRRMTNVAEMRQNARAAVQLIERDVRMAGSGWGRTTIQGTISNVAWTINSINPGYNAGANDSLVMVGAWQANSTLSASMPTSTSALRVAAWNGFATNDMVIVTNGASAHIFQVTSVTTATNTLNHDVSSIYNSATPLAAWPAGGYGVGTQVYKASIVTYKYDATSYRKQALVRREFGQPQQIVAYGITGFRVWYVLDDASRTRNPLVLPSVSKIIPVVQTRVTDPTRVALNDSVWAEIRPRTF